MNAEEMIVCIPFVTQESAIGRVQSAKNRMRKSGLYCLILAHFAAFDFWQLSIPSNSRLLSRERYKKIVRSFISAFFCLGSSSCFGSSLLDGMSLEEKAGQVLMVHVLGDETGEEAKRLVRGVKVGGIIYYNWANRLTSPAQVKKLSLGLQALAEQNPSALPLLIAADQEGGIVARLQEGFTIFPGNRALQETRDPELAKKAAFAMGEELRGVGINMNLAPVVDLNCNQRNPVIGIRSFGDNPETVAVFGEKALLGFQEAQVIATLKHFPGHGDVTVDSHEGLPVVTKSLEELEKVELFPFAQLAPTADAIMTAHLLVPALDSKHSSTLSKKTLSYLRDVLGFKGVIVSDSLVMQGVLSTCSSIEEASILALDAGCDLLILGGRLLTGSIEPMELTAEDIERVHLSIVKAVKTKRLSETKLNQAVERILALKNRYVGKISSEDLSKKVYTKEHRELAETIASLSLQVTEKKNGHPLELSEKKVCIVAPQLLQGVLSASPLFSLGKTTDVYFYQGLNPSAFEMEAAKKQAESSDAIIICSYNAWKNPAAIQLSESLLNEKKLSIVLVLRDPLDASFFPQADWLIQSFSPTAPSIQAIFDQFIKK